MTNPPILMSSSDIDKMQKAIKAMHREMARSLEKAFKTPIIGDASE